MAEGPICRPDLWSIDLPSCNLILDHRCPFLKSFFHSKAHLIDITLKTEHSCLPFWRPGQAVCPFSGLGIRVKLLTLYRLREGCLAARGKEMASWLSIPSPFHYQCTWSWEATWVWRTLSTKGRISRPGKGVLFLDCALMHLIWCRSFEGSCQEPNNCEREGYELNLMLSNASSQDRLESILQSLIIKGGCPEGVSLNMKSHFGCNLGTSLRIVVNFMCLFYWLFDCTIRAELYSEP